MNVTNLKIGARLGLAFGMLLLLMMGIACLSWFSLAATKAKVDQITNEINLTISFANKMQKSVNIVAQLARNYVLYPETELRQKMLERIESSGKDYDQSFERLGTLVRSEKERQLYAELKNSRDETRPLIYNVITLIDGGKGDRAAKFLEYSVEGPQVKWLGTLEEMVDLQEKQNQAAVEKLNRDYTFAVTFLACAVLLALVIGCLLAWWITRGILKQLGGEPDYAVAIAGKIAEGDLAVAIETKANDQSSLLFAIKSIRDNLAKIVGDVRTSTDTIAAASTQVSAGNLDLSSRTEEQASALEETASSMEELTSTVRLNADNARRANQLALSASEVATMGGGVVSQVVGTMGSINESSKKIVDIIGVIDGIAFQTNILALNAAVEAARAGEQGRGFAVVASEVRNLAQRSAAAAKEIKSLIGDSVKNVTAGTKLVGQAGATMDEIVHSVKRVTDIMSEITAASQEQTSGIEHINQAIAQMDVVTQQNASLVEEAAAAAESLQDQAGNLARLVSIFKLDGIQRTATETRALTPHAKGIVATEQYLQPYLINCASNGNSQAA